jgi:endonuclease YncB( thermonuclease family)
MKLCALLVALCCANFQLCAATYGGRVVGVSDGDTITVLDSTNTQHKVRLSGIDAPEKAQAFGHVSKQSLSAFVFSKAVVIDTTKTDKYGREVGKVLVDGQDANLEQVRRGMAWHYKQYQAEQSPPDRQTYSDAEITARSSTKGLWRDVSPVPPWDFRHGQADKNSGAAATESQCITGPRGGRYTMVNGKKDYGCQ